MTDGEKGYLAGMIDGDGCIGSQKNSGCNTYRPYIVVAQKNPKVIDWLVERFGGYIDLVYRNHGNKKCHYFRWVLTSEKVHKVLKLCVNFLVSKKEQAELAIALYEVSKKRRIEGRRSATGEEIKLQKSLYLKIRGLNSPATTERVGSYLEMQQSELARMKNRKKIIRSGDFAVERN